VIEAGHGPDQDIVFSTKPPADMQSGPGTSICINQDLHEIKKYTIEKAYLLTY
jgi:hypothetical protein